MGRARLLSGNRLLDELVEEGKIDRALARAVAMQYRTLPDAAEFLLNQNRVPEEDLIKAVAVVQGIPFVHLTGKTIDKNALAIIPQQLARKYQIIAYELNGKTLKAAVGRPYYLTGGKSHGGGPLAQIEQEKGIKIELAATTLSDIAWALGGYNPSPPAPSPPVPAPLPLSSLASIDLTDMVIPRDILFKFPYEIAKKYQMVVFAAVGPEKLKVGAISPKDQKTKEIISFIERRNGISIELYQISQESFDHALGFYPALTASNSPAPQPPAAPAAPAQTGSVDYDRLPAGQSPEHSGVSDKGVAVIGSKDISPVQSESGVVGLTGTENLEERNLDQFLREMIKTGDELTAAVKSGFIPKIVASILSYGIFLKASDVHLEPMKNVYRLRYRVDGELSEYLFMPLSLHPPITSRIKILSNMKIDEQRIPQDGRYGAIAQSHEFDVRVSSLPTVYGEKIVMRLLDKSASNYTLDQLGLSGKTLERLKAEIQKPWGIIMATGPTGSGKSTTLYAVLNQIADPKVNIITLEDPVEYDIKGANQVQVKPKIGFSFAEGLRSVLRQDPNIIMVGEIRDFETADLATHAALTGHLVLTTLHTNDAAGALPRLINMGIEPFLITSSVNAVIAQRLVRKLCQKCRVPAKIPDEVVEKAKQIMAPAAGFEPEKEFRFYAPKGCPECKNGFSGRTGLYEVLIMSDKIEEAAIKKSPASVLGEIAVKEGMTTMRQDGIQKALEGTTTLDEVFKTTSNE